MSEQTIRPGMDVRWGQGKIYHVWTVGDTHAHISRDGRPHRVPLDRLTPVGADDE